MAVLERKGFVQNDTGTDTAFIKNPFRKQLESPANIPVGDGMIRDSLNKMQKNLKQKYDAMRDTGTWSEEKYQKEMKRLLGDKDLSSNKVYSDVSPSGGFFTGSGEGTMFASADIGKKETRFAGEKENNFFSGDKESFSKFGSDNYRMSQNPDRTIMTGSEVMSSFSPTNIFNPSKNFIGGRFGTYDDPGTPLGNQIASDRTQARESFNAPLTADDRTIAEIRRDQKQAQITKAEERDRQFKDTGVQTFGGKVQPKKSADDTFGTNMMSNPAFGFSSKMTPENKAKYDRSAAIATERAEVNPSIGNVVVSAGNLLKRQVNKVLGVEGGTPLTKEKPLTTKGEYQLQQANEFMNRSLIQRKRSADIAEGISMQDRIARNNEQMRLNAAARYQRFQSDKKAREVERKARRYGQNTGTGRDGGFGAGTVGRGMPSNPAGMRQQGVGRSANNLSRHSTGSSANQPGSTATGGDTSFSSYVRGGGVGQQRGDKGGMKDTNVRSIAKTQGFNMRTAKGQRAANKAAARARAQNAAKKRRAAKKKSKK